MRGRFAIPQVRERGEKMSASRWAGAQVKELLPVTVGIWLVHDRGSCTQSRSFIKGINHSDNQAVSGCIRRSSRHFTLLVVARSILPNAVADVANIIRERSQGSVTVTLLLHSLQDFRASQGNQMHFFGRCTARGKDLYLNPDDGLGKEFPDHFVFDMVKAAGFFQARHDIAAALLSASRTALDQGATSVCRALLNTAVSQVLLGLIKIHLGYRPNHYSLGYLFDVCDLFTTMHSDLFPRGNGEGERLFRILAAHPSSLRVDAPDKYGKDDMAMLLMNTQKLTDSAMQMALDISAPAHQ